MSKRPKPSDFINDLGNVDWDTYHMELEKYCNELEKALEKACRRLAKYDQIIYGDDEPVTAQDYYEWSFEDD